MRKGWRVLFPANLLLATITHNSKNLESSPNNKGSKGDTKRVDYLQFDFIHFDPGGVNKGRMTVSYGQKMLHLVLPDPLMIRMDKVEYKCL